MSQIHLVVPSDASSRVGLIGAHYLLSQVVTTRLVLVWSFAGNRYWTFHSKRGTG